VNDCLTCIPNTKTFWHFLLESVPNLLDKTDGYTNYSHLPSKIEIDLRMTKPDYIIRNATFFRPIKTLVPTISLLQDPYPPESFLFKQQVDVCNDSAHVVYNSEYTKEIYSSFINRPSSIIEIGTDSDLFCQKNPCKSGNTVIFIGSSNEGFKGFNLVLELIQKTSFNFILVMKDEYALSHPRVKVYNKISQEKISFLLNKSDVLICTSKKETLHLAGIEAMFCNVPVVASDVGIYSSIKKDKKWGFVVDIYSEKCYNECIIKVLESPDLSPREYMLDKKMSVIDCMGKWNDLIEFVLGE